jgi:hypothetical protein
MIEKSLIGHPSWTNVSLFAGLQGMLLDLKVLALKVEMVHPGSWTHWNHSAASN